MRECRLTITGLVLAGLAFPAFASAETLQDALAAAYNTNSSLQAQRAALRATDELVPQALSNWRPTIKAQGDVGDWHTYSTSINTPASRNQTLYARDDSVTVSESLYRGGRTLAQTKQAEAQVKAGRAQLLNIEQTVLLNAVTAFANVVQDQSLVKLQQNNEKLLERQLSAANDRLRVGEATRTDVAQAQAAVAGAQAGVIQAQGSLQNDSAAYTDVVGHAPGTLVATDPSTGLPSSLDESNHLALASNPQVVAQQYVYEAAQHAVDVQFGTLLPTLSLNGSYARTAEETSKGSYVNNEQTTLQLQIPIYQQGTEYAQLRALKQTAAQQQLQLDQFQHDVIQSTTTAWDSLQSASAQVKSFQSQAAAAQVALDGVQRQYQVGAMTILDVLTSAQNLLSAQVNLVGAQRSQIVASYQVRSAVGTMTASALQLPVKVYDPTAHYNDVRDKFIGGSITSGSGTTDPGVSGSSASGSGAQGN